MADEKVLRDGIIAYLEGEYERPVGKRWRKDLNPSKYDTCVHGQWMYEACELCIDNHFEKVLEKASTETASAARSKTRPAVQAHGRGRE